MRVGCPQRVCPWAAIRKFVLPYMYLPPAAMVNPPRNGRAPPASYCVKLFNAFVSTVNSHSRQIVVPSPTKFRNNLLSLIFIKKSSLAHMLLNFPFTHANWAHTRQTWRCHKRANPLLMSDDIDCCMVITPWPYTACSIMRILFSVMQGR